MGFADLQAFLDRGGPVLLVIMLATFFMWGLILERVFYFRFAHKQVAADAIAEWRSRSDRKSTLAHWVKDKLVSEVRMKAEQNVQLTKAMVALAPLLGLLGTAPRSPRWQAWSPRSQAFYSRPVWTAALTARSSRSKMRWRLADARTYTQST